MWVRVEISISRILILEKKILTIKISIAGLITQK